MADTDDTLEFVREFLIESTENLDQLDRDLVALEENPADPERLSSIFRTVHTIKGTSGFLDFRNSAQSLIVANICSADFGMEKSF